MLQLLGKNVTTRVTTFLFSVCFQYLGLFFGNGVTTFSYSRYNFCTIPKVCAINTNQPT